MNLRHAAALALMSVVLSASSVRADDGCGSLRAIRSNGAEIIGPYVCPHRFREPCRCKKPATFLYEVAAKEHAIDLHRSFVIGDSAEDVRAARRFGGNGCLVRTGWAEDPCVIETAAARMPRMLQNRSVKLETGFCIRSARRSRASLPWGSVCHTRLADESSKIVR